MVTCCADGYFGEDLCQAPRLVGRENLIPKPKILEFFSLWPLHDVEGCLETNLSNRHLKLLKLELP